MIGVIDYYDENKGFGYLRLSNQRYFFHIRQFDDFNYFPNKFDLVSFELSKGRDGRDSAIGVICSISNYFS